MNFGIIGIGYWGKNVLRNLIIHPKIKNIFVLDKDLNNTKKQKIYITSKIKKNFFSIKDIDVYIICTPTKSHFEYIEECLKLKKLFVSQNHLHLIIKKF